MQARPFNLRTDYSEVATWWKAHGWPEIPPEALSPTGFVVDGICAGWFYKTDSKLSWIEWVVSNPSVEPEVRGAGLDALMGRLIEEGRRLGFSSMFSSISNKRLIERYKKHGFIETETGMSNMIRRL